MPALHGKTVVLGVTGGIAAYKAVELLRLLTKGGATVHVIMTRGALEFVAPLTFQTLSGNPVHTELFNLISESEIGHISLADRADLFIIAPATANIIAKIANGIADDILTTTVMATPSTAKTRRSCGDWAISSPTPAGGRSPAAGKGRENSRTQ